MRVHPEVSTKFGITIPVTLTDAAEKRLDEVRAKDAATGLTVIGDDLTLATVLVAARKAVAANSVTVQTFIPEFYHTEDATRFFYTISRHDGVKSMLIGLASEHNL